MKTRTCPGLEDPCNYDHLIPLVIPHWEAFYSTVAEFVPADAVELLELGSGTGFLSGFLMTIRPSVHLSCIDRNPGAIAIAREKPGLAGTVFIEGDIRGEWPDGPYDAIVTTQCLFQISPAERQDIARRAYESLTNKGIFLNGDLFHPGTAWELDLYCTSWHRFMLNSGLTEEESAAMISPLKPMIREYTVDAWSAVLHSAGFRRVTPLYRSGMYAVIAGLRDSCFDKTA